jgi:hypothetical protein
MILKITTIIPDPCSNRSLFPYVFFNSISMDFQVFFSAGAAESALRFHPALQRQAVGVHGSFIGISRDFQWFLFKWDFKWDKYMELS